MFFNASGTGNVEIISTIINFIIVYKRNRVSAFTATVNFKATKIIIHPVQLLSLMEAMKLWKLNLMEIIKV